MTQIERYGGRHGVTLTGGDQVFVRAIHADDKRQLLDGLERLSPQSRNRRFFSPIKTLGARQVAYLTEVDHRTHEALVAVDPATGQGLGVARFIRSPDDPTVAEVAVAVADDWQNRGVGTALLHELAARAREEGVERFSASVLAENRPMMELLRHLGDVRVIARDHGVVELLMDLPAEGVPASLRQALRAAARSDIRLDARHPARRTHQHRTAETPDRR